MSFALDCDFPGGNILLDGVEGDDVYVRQELRDTEGDWFYWCFRVRGAAGRRLRFHFTGGNVIGVRGPASSSDRGSTWRWLGRGRVGGESFCYDFAADEQDVRFSMAMPYVAANLRGLLARLSGGGSLRVEKLCTTRKGREVERLHLGRADNGCRHRVLLTCRHHACEMMASYALEGLMEAVLRSEGCAWLRRNVEFLAVPFVDKDGVEDGDQGKNRKPRDHGRDYEGESLYASTGAIRRLVPEWSGGRLRVVLDLHCPWLRGPGNEAIYLVGSPQEWMWDEQQRFGAMLEQAIRGPLPYRAADNLPFGVSWNNADHLRGGRGCARWAEGLGHLALASTIEIPYANAGGHEVSARTAALFGRDLATALSQYLREVHVGGSFVSPRAPRRVAKPAGDGLARSDLPLYNGSHWIERG
ncbi:MAG: M14 family zinc carboxypeptidase [Planctomycetota bacterium]